MTRPEGEEAYSPRSVESFIDIGSGSDHYPLFVSHRYGVPAYFSAFVHSEQTAAVERAVLALLARLRERVAAGELPAPDHPVAASLLARVRCPDCRERLEPSATGVRCRGCGAHFAAEHGVPILYPTRELEDARSAAEALDRLCGTDVARRRTVRRLLRRLRRNEPPAGMLRRVLGQGARRFSFHASWTGRGISRTGFPG